MGSVRSNNITSTQLYVFLYDDLYTIAKETAIRIKFPSRRALCRDKKVPVHDST